MSPYTYKTLIGILRDTLKGIEDSTDLNPNDPSVVDLKRTLLLKLAALENEASPLETDHVLQSRKPPRSREVTVPADVSAHHPD
ncbi:MAG TPA: hypothetical protein VMU48_18580 [Terracidiphilus sp.]|nr:hypothetical protein [Terracidiphilus sp.]